MATYEYGGRQTLRSSPRRGRGGAESGIPAAGCGTQRCAGVPGTPTIAGRRRGSAYGLSARFAKMRRVKPFITVISADEKFRIARR